MAAQLQRLPQSNYCTNTKFILEKVWANTKLSEINAHVNTNITSNKWLHKYKGHFKVIAPQIQSLFLKKAAQIERLLQMYAYVNTKVTSSHVCKCNLYNSRCINIDNGHCVLNVYRMDISPPQ